MQLTRQDLDRILRQQLPVLVGEVDEGVIRVRRRIVEAVIAEETARTVTLKQRMGRLAERLRAWSAEEVRAEAALWRGIVVALLSVGGLFIVPILLWARFQ
jgi:hypothetical protein